MMNCEEVKIKISAFIDNEIEEQEVTPVLSHLESCYNCRLEYIELLRLQKKMKGFNVPEPGKEWYEALYKKLPRKITDFIGKVFFFVSYILLIVYALFQFFASAGTNLFIKLLIGGTVLGFLILLGVSIADRIYESKNDRYKGVMK